MKNNEKLASTISALVQKMRQAKVAGNTEEIDLSDPIIKNRYDNLIKNEQIDAPIALRIITLENKEFRNLSEDVELENLLIPSFRNQAKRIADLTVKEEKTAVEERELALLKNPKYSDAAARICYLEAKDRLNNLSKEELLELRTYDEDESIAWLAKTSLAIKQKDEVMLTGDELRTRFLWRNLYSVHYTMPILELERKPELTVEEEDKLLRYYLVKLAKVTLITDKFLYTNLNSKTTFPSCLGRDNVNVNQEDLNIAKIKYVKNYIEKAAENLLKTANHNNTQDVDCYDKDELCLALTKYFFDHDIELANMETIVERLKRSDAFMLNPQELYNYRVFNETIENILHQRQTIQNFRS